MKDLRTIRHLPDAPGRARASLIKKGAAVAGAGLSFLLVLTACAGPTETPSETDAEIQSGGTLNIGISGDPGNLDPIRAATAASSYVFNAMCEKLYEADSEGAVFPQLAAEPAVLNDDNTIARVVLRDGVKFADGSTFDAAAVKYGLERSKNAEGSTRAAELEVFDHAEVIDDLTVDIHLTGPTAPGAFEMMFTTKAGSIVSKEAVETLGDEGFNEAPVCVGPFKFDSRVAQDSVTLIKDDNYYAADKVHLDKVVYRVIPDGNVRATNLRAGDLDVIEGVAVTDVATLEADSNVEIVSVKTHGFFNLDINVNNVGGEAKTPDRIMATDPRLRKALELSINREALETTVFGGKFGIACGFMSPLNELATDKSLSCVDYDPERAKDLIKETGVSTPITVNLMISQQPERRRMAEVIQSMAAEVGFDIVIDVGESTTTVARGREGDYDMTINFWGGRIDPDGNITRFADSSSGRSLGKYSNPEVDQLLSDARSEGDKAKRAALYDELSDIMKRDTPLIFLVRPTIFDAHRSNVVGLEIWQNGLIGPAFAGFTSQ